MFASDHSIAGAGFTASYVLLDSRTECGGRYTTATGVLRSPGYPGKCGNGIFFNIFREESFKTSTVFRESKVSSMELLEGSFIKERPLISEAYACVFVEYCAPQNSAPPL